MSITIAMPKLSDTMEEGTVVRWAKRVGDRVAIGDVLAEVETDKATMELEAYDEGVLAAVLVPEGQPVPVGTAIATLDDGVAAGPPPRVIASPRAKKVATERGVDIAAIQGTGPGGRIVEADVPAPVASAGALPVGGERRVALSKTRRTVAARMTAAKRDVPHFYASSIVAMDEAVRWFEGLRALGDRWAGLTWSHVMLKAVGLALRAEPDVNARYENDAVILTDRVHIGLATATPDGLVVPVVRDCDITALVDLVTRTRALVERARTGRFAADDLTGASFTISNLGMYPVSDFAAVVNPPQAAILAVGAIRHVPVVRSGQCVPGMEMTLTMSSDHRVVDGALAGRFLAAVKARLESPLGLIA